MSVATRSSTVIPEFDLTGKVAVAVLSGGNVDPELFSRLVA